MTEDAALLLVSGLGLVGSAVVGAIRGLKLEKPSHVTVGLLYVVALPAVPALPLLLASDPPWNYQGPILVVLGGIAAIVGANRIYGMYRPPPVRILLGPSACGTAACLLIYCLGIMALMLAGFFSDSDWALGLFIGATTVCVLGLFIGTIAGWVAAGISHATRRRE